MALDKIYECKQEYKIINDLQKDIKDYENFTQVIEIPKVRKIDLKQGLHTTTCLVCNITCHKNCYFADDEEKKFCSSMNSEYKCTFCSKKCDWFHHKNTPYILESYLSKETITLKEIKQKYDQSQSQFLDKKKILQNIKDTILDLNNKCIETQDKITKSINRLKQIALNKDVLSSEEHIEILIQSEQMERKEGFLQRVEALKLLKEQKKLMREAYHNKIPSMEEVKLFLAKTYDEDKHKCLIY